MINFAALFVHMFRSIKASTFFWRATLVIVHVIFLGVFIGFNFDAHSGTFSSRVHNNIKKSSTVHKQVANKSHSNPQKPTIRLNKRFQPESTPAPIFFPGVPLPIGEKTYLFYTDDSGELSAGFYSFLLRGPPAIG